MKKLVAIFLCLMFLSGCTKELGYRGYKPVNKKEEVEEEIEKTEEMIKFDEILNSKENIGFLLSTYSSFDKVDFKELFIEFPKNYSSTLGHSTTEYKNLIASNPDFTDKVIQKMTKSSLNKYLKDKTTYALDDYEQNNLSQLVYMEAYDTYYTYSKFGENLIDTYKIVQDDNIYTIYYKYNGTKYKTIVKKVSNKYIFVSNILNN